MSQSFDASRSLAQLSNVLDKNNTGSKVWADTACCGDSSVEVMNKRVTGSALSRRLVMRMKALWPGISGMAAATISACRHSSRPWLVSVRSASAGMISVKLWLA